MWPTIHLPAGGAQTWQAHRHSAASASSVFNDVNPKLAPVNPSHRLPEFYATSSSFLSIGTYGAIYNLIPNDLSVAGNFLSIDKSSVWQHDSPGIVSTCIDLLCQLLLQVARCQFGSDAVIYISHGLDTCKKSCGTGPHGTLDLHNVNNTASKLDEALGLWLRNDGYVQAIPLVVIEEPTLTTESCSAMDAGSHLRGNRLCWLWYLHTLGLLLQLKHNISTGSSRPSEPLIMKLHAINKSVQKLLDTIRVSGQNLVVLQSWSRWDFSLLNGVLLEFLMLRPVQTNQNTIEQILLAGAHLREHLYASDTAGPLIFGLGISTEEPSQFASPEDWAGFSQTSLTSRTNLSPTSSFPMSSPDLNASPVFSRTSTLSSAESPPEDSSSVASSRDSSPSADFEPVLRTDGKSRRCHRCGTKFKESESVLARMKRHDATTCPKTRRARLPCPIPGCNKAYRRSDSLLNHQREMHPDLNKAPKRKRSGDQPERE